MKLHLLVLPLLFATFAGAEQLYNGLTLPDPWPPQNALTREPMKVPWLESPPEVIPIDLGRQLFVDDFLIEKTTLTREYGKPEMRPEPVLVPDKPWEIESESLGHPAPTAMVFSDGVWYDPDAKLFKMWYMAGYTKCTCYATSMDGIHWDKPELDVVPGTNIVHTAKRDSATVWFDRWDPDPLRRYKMFMYEAGGKALSLFFSKDGIHWSDCVGKSGPLGDRSTVFYNPFRRVWVYSIRGDAAGMGRIRRYWETPDPAKASWKDGEPPFWVGADTGDLPREDMKTPCELYNLDAVAYESVLVGLFSIWRGQPNDRAKPNELCVGFSRDGFHWHRPVHTPFIGVSEKYGDWNWANVQSAGGVCITVDDKLYFYYSQRKGVAGSPASGVSTTGLAAMRRDGFAAMCAGPDSGELTTRLLRFSGNRLFVNIDAPKGELRVEVLDKEGKVIVPFTLDNCTAVDGDKTSAAVSWKEDADIGKLAGQPLRFRFHLRNGRLYSFWVGTQSV